VTVARLLRADALEAANVARFGQEALHHVAENPGTHLLVDMEPVQYLSSAALSELLVLHRKCREKKGDLKLCGMNNDVLKVFQITQLDRIFEIYDSPAPLSVKLYNRSLDERLTAKPGGQSPGQGG
jgi:anti-sigma B factor antagonist